MLQFLWFTFPTNLLIVVETTRQQLSRTHTTREQHQTVVAAAADGLGVLHLLRRDRVRTDSRLRPGSCQFMSELGL